MWIIQERPFKGVFTDIVNCESTATVDGSEILHQSIPISIPFLIRVPMHPKCCRIFVHLHMAPGHLPIICMFQPPHLWPIVSSWWQLNYFFVSPPFGEKIQFDLRIFFRWVGSTTKQFSGTKNDDVRVWNDLWPSKEAMKGGLVQDMFLGNENCRILSEKDLKQSRKYELFCWMDVRILFNCL